MADQNVKWVYEDPDFDNRVANLMWTVSGRYDDHMDIGEKSFISKDVALYHAVTAGARRLYIDWNKVKKFIKTRVQAGFDKDVLLTLLQLSTDIMIEEKVIRQRPGVVDIREKAYEAIVSNFYKMHTGDLLEDVKHGIVLKRIGKSVRMDHRTQNLIRDLEELENIEDTETLLKAIQDLYLRYFPLYQINEEGEREARYEGQDFNQSDFNDWMLEEYYEDEEDSLTDEQVEELLEAISNGMLAHEGLDNTAGAISDNRVLRIQEEDLEKIYEKVSFYYGNSYLPIEEVRRMQQKLCRNAHETCRIHMTDGVMRSKNDNGFQQEYIKRNKIKNEIAYNINKRVHQRNINKLRDSLIRTMVQEEASDQISSRSGQLVANRLWRVGRSNNNKLFVQSIDNDKGHFVVDILIDSSGSQRRNQPKVAAQAYVLSQALTLAGIPNRVNGFSSFLDYTVIKRFRDYHDSISENSNIFEYHCTGNNRDGLAIRTIVSQLIKREEDNKVLIILSDGRPNDIKVGKAKLQTDIPVYRGREAIVDTAMEVRRARQQGVMVLGVFTGREKDLKAEKMIYGKDFVYIKNIDRFADMVIRYIKQIITN
ncbi:MAG: nitric oxide reductase activation-like protein [Eubacteriaceae bacterium]|jgi:hypothetical protein|nr:nitric oxide reductase activation-like protein [Eubacteriaceae bacterium]